MTFDYIQVKMPLPETHPKPLCDWFQTKTAQATPRGDNWVVENDGRLVKKTDRQKEAVSFDGDISFYEYQYSQWWLYTATFSGGICTVIKCDDYFYQSDRSAVQREAF